MKQASFWETLSIRCPYVKFSTLYYLRVSAFISLVYKTDYRKAILRGSNKMVVLYMQTSCCIPKPCWVVGKGVGELFVIKNCGQLSMKFFADTITVLRTRYLRLQCSHQGLTQVPYLRRLLSRECTHRRMCECTHVWA